MNYTSRRLPQPAPLPHVTEEPAAAWANGWWNGIAVGIISTIGFGLLLWKGFA